MNENDIIQDLRDRLIKIETLLEQKFCIADLKTKELEDRLKKVEDNNTWLWRTVAGTIIAGIITLLFKK